MFNSVNSIISDVQDCLDSERIYLSSLHSSSENKRFSSSIIASLGKIDAYQHVLSILNGYPHD